jgi:hypothetical protein
MKCERIECVCAWCGAEYEKRKDRVRSPDYCCQGCRSAAIKEAKKAQCERCGTDFYPRTTQVSAGHGKFCSQSCSMTGRVASEETRRKISESQKGKYVPSGSANPCYKGRWVGADGYVWRNVDGCTVAEHRYVMEQHLGRSLKPDEIVHHINHDKADNRLENLSVMTRAEHMNEHRGDFASPPPLRGESNKSSKLTEAAVRHIRSSEESGSALARRYGVTQTLISMVRLRKIWKHVA